MRILVLVLLFAFGSQARGQEAGHFPVKVAAVQFNPQIGVLGKNVDALGERFEQAAKLGAKIVVAPEMATTGYLYRDRRDIAKFVEPIPGPTTERFAKIAEKYGCYLAWGMPERDQETGLFYNSAAIVGPEGFIGKYRKTHLWESEAHWSAWGDLGVPVFQTRYGRVALLICQDANYVETFRLAALRKADIVCFSTNSSGQTIGHLQSRAIQNGIFIVSANRSDSELDRYNGKSFRMKGCSAIWSPVGTKLAEAKPDSNETIYARIDPSVFNSQARRLSERRPEQYKSLARHVAPWNYRATSKPRRIKAIAVQYLPAPGRFSDNKKLVERLLAKHLRVSCKASHLSHSCNDDIVHARLIVLPELSLAGRVAANKTREFSEGLDGETFHWTQGLAKKFQSYVVCGLIERSGEAIYNSAIVVNPKGEKVGSARKIHLSQYDRGWAKEGTRWAVLSCAGLGRLGVLIGSDSYIAESGTVMAIDRADVVAVPASWHGEIAGNGAIAINPKINPHANRKAMVLWDEMAWGQQFNVVVANTPANEKQLGGRSGIYSTDPIYGIDSQAFARTFGEEVVVGRFQTLNGSDPGHWIDQARYIGSRRPDSLYYPLLYSQEIESDRGRTAPFRKIPNTQN